MCSSSLLFDSPGRREGYSNFQLYILEYCDTNKLLEREQYYIDTLNPTYNICTTAGAPRVGGNHYRTKTSENTIGCKHTKETRRLMSQAKFGANHPMYEITPNIAMTVYVYPKCKHFQKLLFLFFSFLSYKIISDHPA